ncbi:MAG: protein translocase subunit SecD [Candidatus Pacebacteria bacterium]|nr:protein translocase subunit SecD [Candidatus Paceibacterota bacterium]
MDKKRSFLILAGILIISIFGLVLILPEQFDNKLGFHVPEFMKVPFRLGLDLQGGTQLIYQADLSDISDSDKSQKMEQLKDLIERRVNIFGVSEPVVQIQGENRLIVELAGVKDVNEAIKMIGETPYLEFKELLSDEEKQKLAETISEEEILNTMDLYRSQTGEDITREEVIDMLTSGIFKTTELTGEYLKQANIAFDQTTSKVQIELVFNSEGTKLFSDITSRNVGKPLGIFLDGLSIVDTDGDEEITPNDIYAPVVKEKIEGGKAVITGEMDIEKAREIVSRLNSGALPVKIGAPIFQETIGPSLGKVSLSRSLRAGIFGFLAVIIFMIIFYRLPGILASFALLIYVIIFLSIIKLIPVTLTLAGIGGFILSIGMAVDANVLIFSRMREELKERKSFNVCLEEGFRRSWLSIRDGNLTTLIVAFIFFWFGTSFVKGFALTLSIGVVLSMFSAIFITRNMLKIFAGTKFENVSWLWQ